MSSNRWFEDQEWALLEFRGADRKDFLTRLTTNVLPSGESPLVHNFFLSVNAKIQAEFWVSNQGEYMALLAPKAQVKALKECIDRYHFGEKIELSEPQGKLFVVAAADREVLEIATTVFLPDPRYGNGCAWCFVDSENLDSFSAGLGEPLDHTEAERMRITTGRPKYGLDYDDESLFVEVAQQDDFSQSKGCYPGQEIVARVLHRGRLNRHLRGFHSSSPVPQGWLLKVDGKEVAAVRSVVEDGEGGSFGYLMVRREFGKDGESLTGAGPDGKPVTLTVTPRPGEVLTGEEE